MTVCFEVNISEKGRIRADSSKQLKTAGGWRSWESASGATVVRSGPGCTMFVPAGCPHAFANPASGPARMLFLVSPPGRGERITV